MALEARRPFLKLPFNADILSCGVTSCSGITIESGRGAYKSKSNNKMEGVADVRPAENDNGKLPENAIDIYFIDGKIFDTLCRE